MNLNDIEKSMRNYIENQEMSGGALIVRKNGEIVYRNKWGKADICAPQEITYDAIYRMMSLTKISTAVGILKLMDAGKIHLDDPLSKYIPGFADMRVSCDERYAVDMENFMSIFALAAGFNINDIKSVPANRQITIRDLLSHSSGLEQGGVGLLALITMDNNDKTLAERVERYTRHPLDFQPGTGTSYSPLAGFDILGRIIEIVSGMRLEEYLHKEICGPLDMKDTTYFPNMEQKSRLVRVYKRDAGRLVDVTGTKEDIHGSLHQDEICFEQGSGGLYSTLDDYEHLADMLCRDGVYGGKQFLKKETVALMHTEAPALHLELEPGMVWGLGVKIRQDPERADSYATKGTYGWSGAFGTHLFVSPQDDLEAVFMMNRCDIGGSGSYISREVERLVFGIWG